MVGLAELNGPEPPPVLVEVRRQHNRAVSPEAGQIRAPNAARRAERDYLYPNPACSLRNVDTALYSCQTSLLPTWAVFSNNGTELSANEASSPPRPSMRVRRFKDGDSVLRRMSFAEFGYSSWTDTALAGGRVRDETAVGGAWPSRSAGASRTPAAPGTRSRPGAPAHLAGSCPSTPPLSASRTTQAFIVTSGGSCPMREARAAGGTALDKNHSARGAGTFAWPPAGTSTWPLDRNVSVTVPELDKRESRCKSTIT